MVGATRLHHDHFQFRFPARRSLALRHAWAHGRDYQNRITFEEIVPPERIVYRHGGGDDVEPVQFRTTVLLEDLGSRTRVTWRGEFPSAAERNRVIKDYGADKGLAETLARLGNYVAAMAQA